MPRLTSRDYLTNRQFIRQQWLDWNGIAFGSLPFQEQHDLHDYYVPSIPITDEQALRHRVEMTKSFPSLPQKAGKAYKAIRAAVYGHPNVIVDDFREATASVEMIAGMQRGLRITGIARPQIDHYRLARALVNLLRDDVDGELLARAVRLRNERLDKADDGHA